MWRETMVLYWQPELDIWYDITCTKSIWFHGNIKKRPKWERTWTRISISNRSSFERLIWKLKTFFLLALVSYNTQTNRWNYDYERDRKKQKNMNSFNKRFLYLNRRPMGCPFMHAVNKHEFICFSNTFRDSERERILWNNRITTPGKSRPDKTNSTDRQTHAYSDTKLWFHYSIFIDRSIYRSVRWRRQKNPIRKSLDNISHIHIRRNSISLNVVASHIHCFVHLWTVFIH